MNKSLADFLWDTVAPKKKVPRSIPDYLEMVDMEKEMDEALEAQLDLELDAYHESQWEEEEAYEANSD